MKTRVCRAGGVSTPSVSDAVPARAIDGLEFSFNQIFSFNFACASACDTDASIHQRLPHIHIFPILKKVSPICNGFHLPKPRFQCFSRNLGNPNIPTEICWRPFRICSATLIQLEFNRTAILPPTNREREILTDNLLVRVHCIIEMIVVERPCAMGV